MDKKLNANTRYVAMDGDEVVMEFKSIREMNAWVAKANRAGFGVTIKQVIHGAIVELPDDLDNPPTGVPYFG